AAPYLLRLDRDAEGNPLLRTHTGIAAGQVHGWWRDEQGRVFAASDIGPGLIAGRDLPAMLDTLQTPDGSLIDALMSSPADAEPNTALSILPWPSATEGPATTLRPIATQDIPQTLGFVARPLAAKA
ncbi:MAG: DUF2946 family protein, partial [Alcaligenaceae bacterium]|nr:DUF2946 family protein [Alcaligenaceae bacterium]